MTNSEEKLLFTLLNVLLIWLRDGKGIYNQEVQMKIYKFVNLFEEIKWDIRKGRGDKNE